MTELLKRKNVDLLVEQFWRKGYLTLSRKFGTFLPEPTSVGGFEVDVIARQKNTFALGLTITSDDCKNQSILLGKIKYLATRQTRRGNNPVMLFIGAKEENFKEVKLLIDQLAEEVQKNIKLFQIRDQSKITKRRVENIQQALFS
jgi:hypothetical protein